MLTRRAFAALCRQNFSVFFQRAWREMEPGEYKHNWHVDCIAYYLEQVELGFIKRLIINVPPRTGKTLLANIAYSAWVMGRDPGKRVIGVSYGQRLSEKIGYKTRNLMESAWYREVFPHTEIDPYQASKINFMTKRGGGRFSTSVGGTLTGEGGNIIILDDPMNPDEAASDIERMNSNEWIDGSLFSRLNDPAEDKIVVIMQRLHTEDTTGYLKAKSDGWVHVCLPAYTEEKIELEYNGRLWEYEGLLWPERLSQEVLDDLQGNMGSYAFAGQYMQSPVPVGGGEFRREYLQWYRLYDFKATGCNIYITVDPANSKKRTSDYTAMCVWALGTDQNYYVVDGLRERLDPTERIERLFALHRKWNAISGKPPRVGYERYGMMSDIHYLLERQRTENYRFSVTEITTQVRKEDRIRRLLGPMSERRVWLPDDLYYRDAKGLSKSLMNDIVEQEMLMFPVAAHDDFLDAMSMLFDMGPVFPRFTGELPNLGGLGDSLYEFASGGESRSVLDL